VHGANRLGGNGVANSTVFGGIAGDTLAAWVPRNGHFAEADTDAINAAMARCTRPLHQPRGNLEAIRDALAEVMWNDVGILRDATGLERARRQLVALDAQLDETGIDGRDLRFNLSWHDWMNLRNLILVSRAITESALLRENSRGAHYREDFPEAGDLETSEYMCLRLEGESFAASRQPVQFTRVRPGESLIEEESSAVSMK
jgi:fumarate reductase flavoprotein subunit